MKDFLKIKKIKFRAGSRPETSPLEVDASRVIVFVGPNNSGKSLALREIDAWCEGKDGLREALSEIDVEYPKTESEAFESLKGFINPRDYEAGYYSLVNHSMKKHEGEIRKNTRKIDMEDYIKTNNKNALRGFFLQPFTIRLDGRTRFELTDEQKSGDLIGPPNNHLLALFQNNHSRKTIQEATFDAFEKYFVIDPTNMGHLRIKLSDSLPINDVQEQSWTEIARNFYTEAKSIETFSDGVKSFTGIISAVASFDYKIILIDEPEAFLHPPLARKLGAFLTKTTVDHNATLFAATHSSDFLMGCIENTQELTIVRLTYLGGTTARSISASDVKDLMFDPLLRSTNALRGLFHNAVVVAEADADRVFYDEINRRLQNEERGLADTLFVNAQNWQTIPRILSPLRKLGIPAVGIMDLDAITESSAWKNIYNSLNIETTKRAEIESKRQECEKKLKALVVEGKPKPFKTDGVNCLSGSEKNELVSLIDELANYGLFIVDVGELEGWLKSILQSRFSKKDEWVLKIFEALGSDSSNQSYVRAGSNDVWQFLDRISEWVSNPNRLGID